MKKISLTESDLRAMVKETVKRIMINESWSGDWALDHDEDLTPDDEYSYGSISGNDPRKKENLKKACMFNDCEAVQEIDGEDLLDEFTYTAEYNGTKLLPQEIDDLKRVLKPKYEITWHTEDGYDMIVSDADEFYNDVEKIGNSKLNSFATEIIKDFEENTSITDLDWHEVEPWQDKS